MKLTNTQIATLQAALRDYKEKTEGRAFGHRDSTFWREECENANALRTLLDDALSVEVESVQLEPTTEVCGDIHCDGQCPAEGAPAPPRQRCQPALLNKLESAQTTLDLRELLRGSSAADKRALARFLNIPTNDLMEWATTKRMQAA